MIIPFILTPSYDWKNIKVTAHAEYKNEKGETIKVPIVNVKVNIITR